jgi:glutamate N-acetyltransferase/amino-acid N-acetyltransferase
VSVTSPAGFAAAGGHVGVKASGAPDLAVVATSTRRPAAAAAVFTQNKMAAAPVIVSRAHLVATGGRAVAVVLNSGNANAANGKTGVEHAERMAAVTAAALECRAEEVLVCSTGLIGIPFPIAAVEAGIPAVARAVALHGGADAARAIMTTDTVPKEVVVHGAGFTVGGMAKGAAMLAPNMATMLAVVTTDAEASSAVLGRVLAEGVAESFNKMTVDGCTSTNDTVILLASGEAGTVDQDALADAVAQACLGLANQMVGDAEGATKVVRVEVHEAASTNDATLGARAIATSQLTKCSWYGGDPYWGRVASDLGSAGIELDPERLRIAYGGITVADRGVAVSHDRAGVAAHMAGRHLLVQAYLGLGTGSDAVLTNDLSHAYIDENMGTS